MTVFGGRWVGRVAQNDSFLGRWWGREDKDLFADASGFKLAR
jgi:hypothetical protein